MLWLKGSHRGGGEKGPWEGRGLGGGERAWGEGTGPGGRGEPCGEERALRGGVLSVSLVGTQPKPHCTIPAAAWHLYHVPLDGPFTPSVMSLGFEVHIFSRLS